MNKEIRNKKVTATITLVIIAAVTLIIQSKESNWMTKQKQMNLGSDRLNPTVLYAGKLPFWSWTQISQRNTFAADGRKGWGYVTIDSSLQFSYEPLESGFPGENTQLLGATPDGSILFGRHGYRELVAIDRDSKKKIENELTVLNGSSEIRYCWAPFSEKNWLLACVPFPNGGEDETATDYLCYDMDESRKVFKKRNFNAPRGPESREYRKFIPTGHEGELIGINTTGTWELFTLTDTGFGPVYHNKLTRAMSESPFVLMPWTQTIKNYDLEKRYMFGAYESPTEMLFPDGRKLTAIPSVVRWDEEMDNIELSPLLAHIPDGFRILGAWAISPNGEWARCWVKSADLIDDTFYTCFFHLDEKYPLGVSLPVVGASSQRLHGIFVEHEELGTLYIDKPATGTPEAENNAIFIYKMSDFFPALAEVMKQKTGM